jgi:methyl-accepting chemotaxis protein
MKQLGQAFLHLGLWRPAAALMRNLPFPAKMALIGGAFLVPVVWLLFNFIQTERIALGVVDGERKGVAFAQALYPALDASGVWRQQARAVALGDAAAPVDAAAKAFDTKLKAGEDLQAELGEQMGTAAAWGQVKSARASVPDSRGAKPDVVYEQMTALSRALNDMMAVVTDKSGLALDPDMGSYYLMSAVLMRAPTVIQGTAELRGLVGGALAQGTMSPAHFARVARLHAVVQHERNLAYADRAKTKEAEPELAKSLVLSGSDATTEFLKTVDSLVKPGVTEMTGDRAAFLQVANATLVAQYAQAEANLKLLDNMLAARQSRLQQALYAALAVTGLFFVLAIYLTLGFYAALSAGMKSVRTELLSMSMGDMRTDIKVEGKDEMAGLLRELSYMQAGLRDTMRQVRHSSNEVVNASIEIATGTHDLSARTESAAAALEQSSAALEETTSTTGHTVDAVNQATELARSNAAVAARGGEVVAEVVRTMERIQASSSKISEIIGVIDSIAFQTNILALNAAVEAARAGESGRGFAVVASEVRSLAGRSAQAAKEIKTLINSSVEQVGHGTQVVRGAGEAMREIVQTADQVRGLMDEVATAAREQNQGISQIGQAVQELDQHTQANASLVEEAAAAATAQRDAALRMAAMVDEFRLAPGKSQQISQVEGLDVDAMIDGHRQWKVKLRNAIEERASIDVATLQRDDCCALGKWVYGEGKQRFSDRPNFMQLVERHKTFHRVAGQVGELINQKEYLRAEEAVAPGTPFATATREVVQVLSAAKRMGL